MKKKGFFTAAVALLFFLSLISIDSDSWTPLILCVASWIYLAVVAYRNGLIYDPETDEEYENT